MRDNTTLWYISLPPSLPTPPPPPLFLLPSYHQTHFCPSSTNCTLENASVSYPLLFPYWVSQSIKQLEASNPDELNQMDFELSTATIIWRVRGRSEVKSLGSRATDEKHIIMLRTVLENWLATAVTLHCWLRIRVYRPTLDPDRNLGRIWLEQVP